MADDLKTQIDRVKDTHAAAAVEQDGAEFAERARTEAAFYLGRIKQNDHIRQGISANLEAQTILALDRFLEEKKYLALGFDRGDEFLDKSPLSPMTKTQYYTRRALISSVGSEVYDLLTSIGISVRSQKLIAGDVTIQGDRLMIGDQELELSGSSTNVIKEVVESLADDKRSLQEAARRDAKKIADQQAVIDRGIQDNEQLQRNLDALSSGSPYDRDLTRAFQTLLELAESIGQLPEAQKAARGRDAMPVLWSAIQQVKAAYGSTFAFTDAPSANSEEDVLADIAREVNNTIEDDEVSEENKD